MPSGSREFNLKINVISESAFTVQGHGVHSAFTDTIDALREYSNSQVESNGRDKADIVHIHTIGPYALSKLLWSSGAKIVTAHVTPDSFVGSLIGAKFWKPIARWYLRWYYNKADAIIAVSDEVAREVAVMDVTRPVYMLPNMVREATFSVTPQQKTRLRREMGIPEADFVVLGCGQVQPRKRVDTFLEVAESLPDVQFIWVGGMPFKGLAAKGSQMQHAMSHHPKNVTFTGLKERAETVKYFQIADVFFLPSIQETFGLVVVEAAAAGLPLVVRDLEVYKTLFSGNYLGCTDETFAGTIAKLKSDEGYYEKWHEAAARVAAMYDTKRIAEKLVLVYQEVIDRKARSAIA